MMRGKNHGIKVTADVGFPHIKIYSCTVEMEKDNILNQYQYTSEGYGTKQGAIQLMFD